MSPDVDDTTSEPERPQVFQTGRVEDPPEPTTNDVVERPQVFRQGISQPDAPLALPPGDEDDSPPTAPDLG